ncbi:hypothetical protein D7I43_28150 [Micromonospora globbae]|uniref:ATP-dependent DNA ligase family profile domain-containing protein n=1 Tax=Micromonospora globbae TaxID=1894969 RepID=A0A420ETK6_9ACTN|nr:hypothetical protein D7I43_28150 [Micromonospora globbae]
MTWGGEDEKGSWTGLEVNAGPVGEGATAGAVLRRPVAPMLAAPVDAVPERPGLIHEPKWDGYPETLRCVRGETSPRSQPDHANPHA